MYTEFNNMGITERAIEYAVLALSKNNSKFDYHDIARVARCSHITVRRNLPRLIEIGVIEREGSSRNGYRYKLTEKALIHQEVAS